MANAAGTRDQAFIDAAVEDVRDLLEHAAEAADLSKADPAVFRDAAQVLHPDSDRTTPEFFAMAMSVLDRLNTIVHPATARGVRFARRVVTERSCPERTALRRARYWAVGVLAVAFTVYAYVAYGALIVRSIESLRPQIAQNAEQVRTMINANPSVLAARTAPVEVDSGPKDGEAAAPAGEAPAPPAGTAPGPGARPPAPPQAQVPPQQQQAQRPPQPAAGVRQARLHCPDKDAINSAPLREYCRLDREGRDLASQFDAAHDRLQDWRDIVLSPMVFFGAQPRLDAICFDEAARLAQYDDLSDAERAATGGDIVAGRNAALLLRSPGCFEHQRQFASQDDLTERAYRFRQRREQQARAILDTLSVIVLPGLFGLLGATLAHVRELHRSLSESRMDPTMFARSSLQILLGLVLGALTGVLFSPTFVVDNFGLSLVALAFLAGYSVETAFRFINEIMERIVRTGAEQRPPANPTPRPPLAAPPRRTDAGEDGDAAARPAAAGAAGG